MAIKALEQEPCEDAISRQAAIDAFGLSEKTRKYGGDHSGYDTMMLYEIQNVLENLPSVQQKPKTGHWIEVIDEIDSLGNKTWHHECSICGNEDSGWGDYKYCPNCGYRMVDP